MNTQLVLSPNQKKAALTLLEGIAGGRVLVLHGAPGSGKTTILRHVHKERGGAFIGVRALNAAVEGAFLRAVEDAIYAHDLVLVDDLHLVSSAAGTSTRRYLLDAALTSLLGEASVLNKTIVFALRGGAPWSIGRRAITWSID
jgi:broad-specificity NMP kinase